MHKSIVGLFVLLIIMSTQMVFAGETSIEGTHKVGNYESLKTGQHTFVLSALNEAPMPEGSVDGVKKVTISSNEPFSFGGINYSEDGTYEYTVTRETEKSDRLEEDASKYFVTVYVQNGDPLILIERDGDKAKTDKIEYMDDYYCLLTFATNGGAMEGQNGTVVKRCKLNSTVIIPEGAKKKGYVFQYWKGSKYYPGDEYKVTGDHSFEAIYKVAATDKDEESKSKSVKTGDDGGLFLYIGLLIMSAASLAVIKLKRR